MPGKDRLRVLAVDFIMGLFNILQVSKHAYK